MEHTPPACGSLGFHGDVGVGPANEDEDESGNEMSMITQRR